MNNFLIWVFNALSLHASLFWLTIAAFNVLNEVRWRLAKARGGRYYTLSAPQLILADFIVGLIVVYLVHGSAVG